MLCIVGGAPTWADSGEKVTRLGPELLSFDELIVLSGTAAAPGALAAKVDRLLREPFVSNAAEALGIGARQPVVEGLGPVLRAAQWNIDHGAQFDWIRLALSDVEAFKSQALRGRPATLDIWIRAEHHLRALRDVDLLILNEVDFGLANSAYRDVARELADALGMNYAYGVEFIEVDQRHLGLKPADLNIGSDAGHAMHPGIGVDALDYRGLHGGAILSRYPIRHARIHRLPVCHDWYDGERNGVARLEQGRRWAARTTFLERIAREVRHGGRMALVADILVPALPSGAVTVVAAQLENKTNPACRRKQMDELLRAVSATPHPVILAGDLNTGGIDATPTSLSRELKKYVGRYEAWARRALQWFTPVAIPGYLTAPLNYVKNMRDPTAIHVPLFATNAERELFNRVKSFRFADGGAFDFRGERERTLSGKAGSLANSNARAGKGFRATFTFPRHYRGLVGRYKLDWFFIKPFVADPGEEGQSYRFAPHFPRTMEELNAVVPGGISNHHPITVDLPLFEPSS